MLEMIERLLLEADLEKELPKLEVFGKTIDGIKEFLSFLLMNPDTGRSSNSLALQVDSRAGSHRYSRD
jgi:hypothetical protein